MNEIEIVIPLGPTGQNNDMPNKEYLIYCLENLKKQTMKVNITIAADENLQDDRKEIIKRYVDKIKWFEKDSYFRPGCIWKKIVECWEESDCTFVGWQGYDDFSSLDRFELQYKQLEWTEKNSSFCSNYVLENNEIKKINDGNIDFNKTVGNHPAFVPSYLIRKDAILKSGICDYKKEFGFYFEGFLNLFILKTGRPLVCSNAKFIRREHKGTISETYKEQWFEEAFKRTGYSVEQCKKDWYSLNFQKICEEFLNENHMPR